ncbi:hypothetical protein BaRGS_00023179 [Batillaria attramentaria]|uniref:Protein THEM6 n=1 Tax=Batillaria attramentaria TaxID=370345 RepID=A0ABD0KEQ8_9CAEN
MWSKITSAIQCKEFDDVILKMSRVALPVSLLWMLFDVSYFVRTAVLGCVCALTHTREPPGPFAEQVYSGICLSTDLDYMLHMNNGRYLRECDFARFHYCCHSHMREVLKKMGASYVVKANNIRYRRSIHFLERFRTHTKLVYWDDRNFYLQQLMIRTSDNFICAVNYSAHTVLTTTNVQPQDVLNSLYGHIERPPAPPEVAAWIHSTELSSKALRRSICLTTDLDFMLHMNNGRYLRECDFARFNFWFRSHLYAALGRLHASITNKANNIRYRRSIEFLQRFHTHTKLVYWDKRNFYLEQKMIRTSDNFICAVNYTCQTVSPASVKPQDVLDSLYGHVDCPPAPPEIAAWIQSTELSSQALRRSE